MLYFSLDSITLSHIPSRLGCRSGCWHCHCAARMAVEHSSSPWPPRTRSTLHRVPVQLLSRRRRSTEGGDDAGAEPIAAPPRQLPPPPPPPTAARPRMKWSLRTAPTWRRATDRLPQEREGERAAASTAFLPHRRCMDVQLIRPLSSSGSSHSSDPLTLLFVLHLAPEQRGALARHRPLAHSLQERREGAR